MYMATYFDGNSEIQEGGDGLQTLILMNPGFVGYSDNQPPPQATSSVVLLGSNSSGSPLDLPHAPSTSQFQQFVGIPVQGASSTQDPNQHGFLPRVQYNLYKQSMNLPAARDVTLSQHQGLSLSLSSQQQGGYDVRVSGGSPSSASGVSNGMNGVRNVLFSSKYFKAARELLDEVAKVGKTAKNADESTDGQSHKTVASAAAGAAVNGGIGHEKQGSELTTADKHQIQMKKAKLINMLDEVEQRFRQYHHQMQTLISWFEQVAGIGSAKTYTALALQTISKQFRCLKDAILAQIQASSKSLGEEDNMGGKIECSRLKYVDNQIRQQRALQQLGMIQHNTWRPQRGLPERSVSVLRAWLFEHFLHPYPKDSDKIMLAKQTGLTRSQVSNWFINARVRLWKPMVEEMYMEEVKELDQNGSEEDKSNKSEQQNEDSTSKSTTPKAKNPITVKNNAGFYITGSSELGSITQGSPKKPRSIPSINMDSSKPDNKDERQNRDGFTLMGSIGGFGCYPMGELGRSEEESFQTPYPGNGFSLTLGLPHCENIPIQGGSHHSFLPTQNIQRLGIPETNYYSTMNNSPTSNHSTIVYESINIQNPRGSLLPDVMT